MSALPIAVIRRNFLVTLVFGSALCTILLTVPGHAQVVPIKRIVPSRPPAGQLTARLRQDRTSTWDPVAPRHAAKLYLEQALATRQPSPGLVHHSDRGVQYAAADYVQLLQRHHMIPSMSRPANPYDNASCESFMKTLKREEIYANAYRDIDHLAVNIETFIDEYYNQCRLHSALGYRPPDEFERQPAPGTAANCPAGATVTFFRTASVTTNQVMTQRGTVLDDECDRRGDARLAAASSQRTSP